MESKNITIDEIEKVNGYYEGTTRKNIHFGIVSIIKFVDNSESLEEGQFILDKSSRRTLIAQDLRKILLSKNNGLGRDILYTHNGEPYEYEITDLLKNDYSNSYNNTIIIRDPEPIGELLGHMGVHKNVTQSELRDIKKLVLKKDEKIDILPHSLKLTPNGIINLARAEEINHQSIKLHEYKTSYQLPIRPRKIEKVYAKYFK